MTKSEETLHALSYEIGQGEWEQCKYLALSGETMHLGHFIPVRQQNKKLVHVPARLIINHETRTLDNYTMRRILYQTETRKS